MERFLFHQLAFVREQTLRAVEGLPEAVLDLTPEGFNNNIRWNLGHIYVVQELFAFYHSGEPMQLFEEYNRFFARGTKPADWQEIPPSSAELFGALTEQPGRILTTLHDRLDETANEPRTTSTGITLRTLKEMLSYTLYHEGMHFTAITLLKRFASKQLQNTNLTT